LDAPVLPVAPEQARTGDNAVVLGYPGGGPDTASAARVREVLNLNGPDIYKAGTTQREVYTVRGSIRQGNSGGPMVDDQGRVLGVVFGAAVDDSDTGFVLTAQEVSRQLNAAASASTPVPTGACIL
jgi:S1-C subfamily serine protease